MTEADEKTTEKGKTNLGCSRAEITDPWGKEKKTAVMEPKKGIQLNLRRIGVLVKIKMFT